MLLRLKQASNAAFSFLSHDDPIHPYYVFLKSWGEAALGKEYARQQQLQVERAEAKLRAEADEKERAAAAAKGPCLLSPPFRRGGPTAATAVDWRRRLGVGFCRQTFERCRSNKTVSNDESAAI